MTQLAGIWEDQHGPAILLAREAHLWRRQQGLGAAARPLAAAARPSRAMGLAGPGRASRSKGASRSMSSEYDGEQ